MATLVDLMTEICRQQHFSQYVVAGFYLTPDQLNAVVHLLEVGSRFPDSWGDFRGIPVYSVDQAPEPAHRQIEILRGIRFTYWMLDARLPLTISFHLLDMEDQLRDTLDLDDAKLSG